MQTCGPLYLDGLLKYAGDDPEKVRLFAAGFITGQAEKAALGASMAAMFRPSEIYRGMVQEVASDVACRYGLQYQMLGDEIWLYASGARMLMWTLKQVQSNSPEWHTIRGFLCGVPSHEIDVAFHRRKGYGEPYDRKEG